MVVSSISIGTSKGVRLDDAFGNVPQRSGKCKVLSPLHSGEGRVAAQF